MLPEQASRFGQSEPSGQFWRVLAGKEFHCVPRQKPLCLEKKGQCIFRRQIGFELSLLSTAEPYWDQLFINTLSFTHRTKIFFPPTLGKISSICDLPWKTISKGHTILKCGLSLSFSYFFPSFFSSLSPALPSFFPCFFSPSISPPFPYSSSLSVFLRPSLAGLAV